MKLSVRIVLWVLCAVMILALPFAVSSPQILEEAQWEIIDELDASGNWSLFPTAYGEAEWEEAAPEYELPIDRTPGMKPNPANYTADSYEDDSISVHMETLEQDGVLWRVARVNIASPTQLRTNFYAKDIKSNKGYGYVTKMAAANNAVVAMNGSAFTRSNKLHSFEIRMKIVRQTKTNKDLDILITDENGDFHVFPKSKGADTFEKDTGHEIINAFMFGPALVKDGEVLKMPKKYANYAVDAKNPRAAIGQIDKLTYVMVVAEGRTKDSQGCTFQQLADFMGGLGCTQAYNLDGGNSAILVFNNETYNTKAQERDINDMIYFATAVPEEAWN